jgi:hypothetical protein
MKLKSPFKKSSSKAGKASNGNPVPSASLISLPFVLAKELSTEKYTLTLDKEGGWEYKSTTSEWVVRSDYLFSINYEAVEEGGSSNPSRLSVEEMVWSTHDISKVTELGEKVLDGIGTVRPAVV